MRAATRAATAREAHIFIGSDLMRIGLPTTTKYWVFLEGVHLGTLRACLDSIGLHRHVVKN
jgi:hypothetical protein